MTLEELLDLTGLSPESVERKTDAEIAEIVRSHLGVCQPTSATAGVGTSIKTADVLASAKKKIATPQSMQETLRQLAEMKKKLTDESNQP